MTATRQQIKDRTLIAEALSSRIMELVILPTEDCNFRCTYCFEDHVPGRMSERTSTGIKKLIERRVEGLSALRISWFGGEPLAAKATVLDVTEFAYHACQRHGVAFSGDMTTNGYLLTPAVAGRLAPRGVNRYFVSLAGVGEEHDRLRPLASGRGSFARIWANLLALQASDLEFQMSLRLHIGTNIAACEALCRQVNRQFGGDRRFRACPQRIADLGGPYAGTFETVSAADFPSAVKHLSQFLTDIEIEDGKGSSDFVCTAARPNNMVIRPDGRISRCVAHLDDPRNTVGSLDDEGRLRLDEAQYRPWFKGLEDADTLMLACPYTFVPKELWGPTSRKPFPVRVVSEYAASALCTDGA